MKHTDFETTYKSTWCPGCGNHAIALSMRQALAELNLKPDNVLINYGIGCFSNGANFSKSYVWHSLHGRPVPSAVGAKLANQDLTVLASSGDGDAYGEGLGHLIHAIRGNADITYIVQDNKVYGLTTGQAAPTSNKGYKAKSTPEGIIEKAVNPIGLALANGCTFVARGFAGDASHLKSLIMAGIQHKGFAFIDVFQPCVTFNKVNTFKFYYDRLYNLDKKKDYNNKDLQTALKQSQVWGNKIPYGIFYQGKRDVYGVNLPQLKGQALVKKPVKVRDINNLMKVFA